MTPARDIEDRAARWLIRSEDPEWSSADQGELEAWLEESMAHKAAYWRLEHGWREADRIGSLGRRADRGTGGRQAVMARYWKPAAIAASLAAIIGIGALQFAPNQFEPAVVAVRYDTPVGGHRTIPLSDGSKIELNTGTVMRAAVSDSGRELWLDSGEAYFEVAHDANRPFVVHAGSKTVTVLGTKFSVRRDRDKVIVSVVEGRVRIDDATKSPAQLTGAGSATITGGDVAISRGQSTLLTARSEERVENALAWRDGMLTFDQATLAEAATEFNRYNRKQIVITDPEAASIRIGGTFQASNVDAFVRLLRDAYGLRVTNEATGVKISN